MPFLILHTTSFSFLFSHWLVSPGSPLLTQPYPPPRCSLIIPGTPTSRPLHQSILCLGSSYPSYPLGSLPSLPSDLCSNCILSMRFPLTILFYTGICPASQSPTPWHFQFSLISYATSVSHLYTLINFIVFSIYLPAFSS